MRHVHMTGGKYLTDDAMTMSMMSMMADRFRGAQIVIVDERRYGAPASSAPSPRAPAPNVEPIADRSYVDRAKATAETKRARKAARRALDRRALDRGVLRHAKAALTVRNAMAPEGGDLNDVLLGRV